MRIPSSMARFSELWSLPSTIDPLHDSKNIPARYPTMHHFNRNVHITTCVHISASKWGIVIYLSNALWDLWDGSIGRVLGWWGALKHLETMWAPVLQLYKYLAQGQTRPSLGYQVPREGTAALAIRQTRLARSKGKKLTKLRTFYSTFRSLIAMKIFLEEMPLICISWQTPDDYILLYWFMKIRHQLLTARLKNV